MKKSLFLSVIFLILLVPMLASAATGFVQNNIWLSQQDLIEGDQVTIFALLVNSDTRSLDGEVVFSDLQTAQVIGAPVSFFLDGGGESDVIFVDWTAVAGEHQFQAQIQNATFLDGGASIPASGLLSTDLSTTIVVQSDTDNDGISDQVEIETGSDPVDPDSDDDGLGDAEDPNPINPDTDGDGDGDATDPEPENASVFTPPDFDQDGIPDSEDSDDDNDGLFDFQEEQQGTSSLDFDSDNDGISDSLDAFPTDPTRSEAPVIPVVTSGTIPTSPPEPETEETQQEDGQQRGEVFEDDIQVLGEKEIALEQVESDGGQSVIERYWMMIGFFGFAVVLLIILLLLKRRLSKDVQPK